MFVIKRQVRYSECDSKAILTIPGIVNHFQDTSSAHSESLGVGRDYMKAKGKAWILASWQICICRRPAVGEEIEVGTWPTSFKGFYGDRNYLMTGADGEVLAYANSIWIYMDIETGRPQKPDPEDIAAYTMEPPYEMEYAPRKIVCKGAGAKQEMFPVRKCHIDTNCHVNNGKYVEMAMEYLPEDFEVKQLRVDYKKAAVYGDTIVPEIIEEENKIFTNLCDEAGILYTTIEWTGENK